MTEFQLDLLMQCMSTELEYNLILYLAITI